MASVARTRITRRRLHALVTAAGTAVALNAAAASTPQNPTQVSGTFNTTLTPNLGGSPGQTLTVTTDQRNTIIGWSSFNIANGNTVNFIQPNAVSNVLNRVQSVNPSLIDGALLSNGRVFLVNPAGVIFGANATINTGGFVAAAGTITDADFLAGNYKFTNLSGPVTNLGTIRAPVVALIGQTVTQRGVITGNAISSGGLGGAPQFDPAQVVILAAGENVLVGENFGSVFVEVPGSAGGIGGAPGGAGDVFSIAAWHTNGASTSARTVRINSAGSATLDGNIQTQNLDASGRTGITVGGTVVAGNALLNSELGGISGPGVITADTLTANANRDINLTGASGDGNRVQTLNATTATGNIAFVNEGDLNIANLQTAPGGVAGIRSNTGSLDLINQGTKSVGTLSLRAPDGSISGQGLLTADQLNALAALGVDLRGTAGIVTGQVTTPGNSFLFDNQSGQVSLNGISATLDIQITSAGGISIVGGQLSAGNNITLLATGGNITAPGGSAQAGNAITMTAPGGLIDAEASLTADQAAFQAAGGITASDMTVNSVTASSSAGGNIALNNSQALVVNAVSTTADVTISAEGSITIAAIVAGEVITLNATPAGTPTNGGDFNITIDSQINAGSALIMTATGDITTQGAGVVSVGADDTPGSLDAQAGGEIGLDVQIADAGATIDAQANGGDLSLGLLGDAGEVTLNSLSAAGQITIGTTSQNDAGGLNLVIGNFVSGADIIISTTGTMTVNGTVIAGVDALISFMGDKGLTLNPSSSLSFAGSTGSTRVLLRAIAGTLEQTGAAGITADQLLAVAQLFSLLGSNNQVAQFAGAATTGAAFNNGTDLEITMLNFGGEGAAGMNTLLGNTTLTNQGNILITEGVASNFGNTSVQATGTVTIDSVVAAGGDTDVSGDTGVLVNATGQVNGANIGVSSSAGGITVDGEIDAVANADLTADGDILINATGSASAAQLGIDSANGNIEIAGEAQADGLAFLRAANGSITTPGGLITAQQLQVLANLGIDITARANGASTITVAGRTDTNDLSINSLTPVEVGQVASPFETTDGLTATAGDVNLRSITLGNAGISITRAIQAASTVRLDTRGDLTASGEGRIIAPTLIIGGGVGTDDERPTLVDLLNITGGGDTNQVATVDIQARGQVLFRNDGALLIQRIATSDFVLVLNDGTVQVVEITTNAAGDVGIIAENGDIQILGGPGAAGINAAGRTIVLDARSGGASVFDAGSGEALGVLTAAQLKVLADSGIILEADHVVDTLAAQTRTGDIRFFNTTDLTIGEIDPIAGVPADAALAGVTTTEAQGDDIIQIAADGSIFLDRDIQTIADAGLVPPDNRLVRLTSNNGFILGTSARVISPRLELSALNGIELTGNNLVDTLTAVVTGGAGPFPPNAENSILYFNGTDLVVELADAADHVFISSNGSLRLERVLAGLSVEALAVGDIVVADRGAFAETILSGTSTTLDSFNDLVMEDGAIIDAGGALTVLAIRDILQGQGGAGAQAFAGGDVLYSAGRAIDLNNNALIQSDGILARLLAAGQVNDLGIRMGDAASIVMTDPTGGVFLRANSAGIAQAADASIRATQLEALAGLGVDLNGINQVADLAGNAADGSFLFNNIFAPVLTIAALNLDGAGDPTIGVTATGDVIITTNNGGLSVDNPVLAINGNADLAALSFINVPSSVTAGANANLFTFGTIDVSGLVDAANDAALTAGTDITVSGLVDAQNNALLDAGNDIDITGTGIVDAGVDATLDAGNDILVAGQVLAGQNALANAGNDIAIAAGGVVQTGNNTALTANNDIAIAGTVAAGNDANLVAGSDIGIAPGGIIGAGGFATLLANGLIDIDGTLNATLGSNMNAGTGIDISGLVLGGTTTGVASTGEINISGIIDVNGDAIMDATTGPIVVSGQVLATGDAALLAAQNIDMSGTINAALTELNAGGAITATGSINTAQLLALASLGIDLSGANVVANFAANTASGSIFFNNNGDLVITGVSRAGGGSANGVRAAGNSVTIVNAGGDVTIDTVPGASIQAALADLRITGGELTGAGIINANQLRALASQGITLTGANLVGTLAASTNSGPILFNNQGNLIIGQVTGTNGVTTTGVQGPGTVSIFSQSGDIDVQTSIDAGQRLNLSARQGGISGTGNINTPEAFLLAFDDIDLINQGGNLGSFAASSLGGSVRVRTAGATSLERLTLSESLRQVAGLTAEQATIDGLFANHRIELRADGNIDINVDRIVALNNANNAGSGDAIILDTGYSASNAARSIVLNGLAGSDAPIEFDTQGPDNQGNGGSVRLIGNLLGNGQSAIVWAGPNGQVEIFGNVGQANQRLASLIVADRGNQDIQSFRPAGGTTLRGDVFVSERLLIQGDTTIGQRIAGPDQHTIDVGGGTLELFGDLLAEGNGQRSLILTFDLNDQFESLNEMEDEFSVRVPLRFYGSIGTESNPFESVRLGGDLSESLASTAAFIDSNLRLNEFGQFNVDQLTNIHTDEAFNIWTTQGLTMGDAQRMLVLGDLNIRSNNPSVEHFLSDITVVGTSSPTGFVGGNLLIDGDVFLLTRTNPLLILDRFTVLPSNANEPAVSDAFDQGVDLIATDSITINGTVSRIPGRLGFGSLSTQSGANITTFGTDFVFRTFGGSLSMADALIAAEFPGTIDLRVGPVVGFDLVATGATNDNLGEVLAGALPEVDAAEAPVDAGIDVRDIDVLQRELGLFVERTTAPSDLVITTGDPRANTPALATAQGPAIEQADPPVIRERISPEAVRRVVRTVFDTLGTSDVVDAVRFPEYGGRTARIQSFRTALTPIAADAANAEDLRQQTIERGPEDPAARMLLGVDALMANVSDLGLSAPELESVRRHLATRFYQAISEVFIGEEPIDIAATRTLLGFPPAAQAQPDAEATVAAPERDDTDRPAVSLNNARNPLAD
ncbi:MAG: two-partner secretion domain-containing protein [Phycisphaerales bacterium]